MPLKSDILAAAHLEAEIDGEARIFPLTGGSTLQIGRSNKNEVVLSDDLASRHHAMLQRSGMGVCFIADLGSSNGTFVNGARISAPVILRPGDRIAVGNHKFSFHQEAAVQSPPVENPERLNSTSLFSEERLITVLVTDIRDFTGLAQRMGAEIHRRCRHGAVAP